jgi:hypothetical protein
MFTIDLASLKDDSNISCHPDPSTTDPDLRRLLSDDPDFPCPRLSDFSSSERRYFEKDSFSSGISVSDLDLASDDIDFLRPLDDSADPDPCPSDDDPGFPFLPDTTNSCFPVTSVFDLDLTIDGADILRPLDNDLENTLCSKIPPDSSSTESELSPELVACATEIALMQPPIKILFSKSFTKDILLIFFLFFIFKPFLNLVNFY